MKQKTEGLVELFAVCESEEKEVTASPALPLRERGQTPKGRESFFSGR